MKSVVSVENLSRKYSIGHRTQESHSTLRDVAVNGVKRFGSGVHHPYEVKGMRVFIDIQDDQGSVLFRSFHDDDDDDIPVMYPGLYASKVTIPANLLAAYPHLLCVKTTIFCLRYTIPEEGVCIAFQVAQTGPLNPEYLGGKFVGRFALPLDLQTSSMVETPVEDVFHA